MRSVRIKICGVTSPDDALLCVNAGVDMIGLIFAESPRQIDAKRAYEIIRAIPPDRSTRSSPEVDGPFSESVLKVHPVGVFMDQPLKEVKATLKHVGLSTVQLHGKESPEYVAELKSLGVFVIKTLMAGETGEDYGSDLFLLDIPKREERDEVAYRKTANRLFRRLFLSGQLDASNVGQWIRDYRPLGVDACRATESDPGRKDEEKVKAFVEAVTNAG